jgi:hypothetical protein
MGTNEKPELRKEKRISTDRTVSVKKDNGIAQEWEGQTRDVSSRGIFMYMNSRVTEGSELELVFPMPSAESAEEIWVRCKARVVRVEQTEAGDRFGVAAEIENYQRLEDTPTHEA